MSKVLRLIWMLAVSYFVLSCATIIPINLPRFPSATSPKLRDVLGGTRNVAVFISQQSKNNVKLTKWNQTMEAAVKQRLHSLGYYELVDLGGRKRRIQEQVFSQSGLSSAVLAIGRELQVENFITVSVTSPPVSTCTKSESVRYVPIYARDSDGNRIRKGTKCEKDVSYIRTVSGSATGRLTRVETGRTVPSLFHKNLRSQRSETLSCKSTIPRVWSSNDSRCHSVAAATNSFMDWAGRRIAADLSPKVIVLKVPMMKKSKDLAKAQRKKVEKIIQAGVQWLKDGDIKEAYKQWREALSLSQDRSVAARWNMGVYYWRIGKLNKAESYLRKVLTTKRKFLSYRQKKIIRTFIKEKKEHDRTVKQSRLSRIIIDIIV